LTGSRILSISNVETIRILDFDGAAG